MIKVIKGDLLQMAKQGDFDLIAHGCNSFCTMGAGIALGVKTIFPEAYKADQKTLKGDKGKLGKCTGAKIQNDIGNQLIVMNCYTQYYYDSRDGSPLSYDALKSSLTAIVKQYGVGNIIGIPMIGYGLAGGELIPILNIFYDVLIDYDVTIVIYDKDPKADSLIEAIEKFDKLQSYIINSKL